MARNAARALLILLLLAGAWMAQGLALDRRASMEQTLPLAFLQPAPASLGPLGFVGALADMRRVAADSVYIDLLQYYGFGQNRLDNRFQRVIPMADQLLWLDPHFRFGILYTGAIMGFMEDHIDEAIRFFDRAAHLDPGYARYRLYLAGLAYRKANDNVRALQALELMEAEPGRPEILVRTLGNLYLKNKDWPKVRAYWTRVMLSSSDPRTLEQARKALKMAAQNGY